MENKTIAKYYGIKLNSNLNLLRNILDLIKGNYSWSILYLYAVSKPGGINVLELESSIEKSSSGLLCDVVELNNLSSSIEQFIDVVIIANADSSKLRKYDDDKQMYLDNDIVIEMIDSDYWLIHAKERQIISDIEESFPNTEIT